MAKQAARFERYYANSAPASLELFAGISMTALTIAAYELLGFVTLKILDSRKHEGRDSLAPNGGSTTHSVDSELNDGPPPVS